MDDLKFDRSVFSADSIDKYFDKYISEIEKLYHGFSKVPDKYIIYFLSEKE